MFIEQMFDKKSVKVKTFTLYGLQTNAYIKSIIVQPKSSNKIVL